jgi:release factor glutamine methyltransferase
MSARTITHSNPAPGKNSSNSWLNHNPREAADKENGFLPSAENAEVLRKIFRAIRDAPESVYSPSDDSFLMLDTITKLAVEGREVLDMGTGSGILGLFCAMRGATVTLTDIDEAALQHAKKAAGLLGLGVQIILSDMFSKVQGQFDLVLFNPPYLPSSTVGDRTVDGGRQGTELSKRFLAGLSTHLRSSGTTLLLVSSLNDPSSFLEGHPEFQYSVLAKRPLFFEELRVLCVRFRENLAR